MSALSDLLTAARGDTSVREVGRRVAVYGVGESTIIPYFSGTHGRPSVAVLSALSAVLNVPVARLREAAGQPAGEQAPYVPPPEADLLSHLQRQLVDDLIRNIVAASSSVSSTDE